jgi:hypothetical protein
MKKADRKLLEDNLGKALAAPKKKPRQDLDALLDEYDDKPAVLTGIPTTIPTGIPKSIPTPAKSKESREADPFIPLDATHTASEKSVYSIMYRETVSKGVGARRFGPAELMAKTGIRSRNTVHKALYGLQQKLSVEVIEAAQGNPLGPRYRVHKPQEIEQRRKAVGMKIDPQSKQIVAGIPASIPSGIPGAIAKSGYPSGDTTIPNIGIVIKDHDLKDQDDDERARSIGQIFMEMEREVTGANKSTLDQWAKLKGVLLGELKSVAARSSVNSASAILAEHLTRRFAKPDAPRKEGKRAVATTEPQPLAPEQIEPPAPAEMEEYERLRAELEGK